MNDVKSDMGTLFEKLFNQTFSQKQELEDNVCYEANYVNYDFEEQGLDYDLEYEHEYNQIAKIKQESKIKKCLRKNSNV